MTSSQVALEFLLMLPMPWVINKIGARNGLIAYGVILALRILGSALVPNLTLIIVLRLLAGLEMPLLLISIMKYIAGAFDLRLYATVYAFSSNFAKQISVFFISSIAGTMYDQIGFQQTYLIMGIIVAIVTIFCAFTLKRKILHRLAKFDFPLSFSLEKSPLQWCNAMTVEILFYDSV